MGQGKIAGLFMEKAGAAPGRIVFAEGENGAVISAAVRGAEEGLFSPVLLGGREKIVSGAAVKAGVSAIEIISPEEAAGLEEYAAAYSLKRGVDIKIARRLMKKKMFFGGMMVSSGDADGMVAGIDNPTAAVLQAAGLTVGYEAGISAPSSFFIMEIPRIEGREDDILVFADCAVNMNPTPLQLGEIAALAGKNAGRFLGLEPKVAMISFSTAGSAAGDDVEKVREALAHARRMAPGIAIDGEFQVDAAIIPRVAEKKVRVPGAVAGRANVLIFPDLDAGNAAYKVAQYIGGAGAYGPFLQGFAAPVNDLSRGASAEDVLVVACATAVMARPSG